MVQFSSLSNITNTVWSSSVTNNKTRILHNCGC